MSKKQTAEVKTDKGGSTSYLYADINGIRFDFKYAKPNTIYEVTIKEKQRNMRDT